MDQPNYEIFIRDNSFRATGVVTRFTSLELVMRYNDIGSFSIEMLDDGGEDTEMMKAVFRQKGYGGGIIVTRNSQIVFSGFIRGFEATGEYAGEDNQESIVFHGWDDTGYLASRLSMVPPTPSVSPIPPQSFVAPFYQGWGYWVYPQAPETVNVSQVMRNLLLDNICSNSTPVNRRISQLNADTNTNLGPTSFVSRNRYENLLSKVQEAANYIPPDADDAYLKDNPEYDGLMFRIIQTEEGSISFQIDTPRNDTKNSVVFSKGFGNISSYRYKVEQPEVNFLVAGGMNYHPTNWTEYPNKPKTPRSREDLLNSAKADQNPLTRFFWHKASNKSTNNLVARYGLWEGFLDRRDVQYPRHNANGDPVSGPPRAPNVYPVTPSGNDTYQQMNLEMINAMQNELIERRDRNEIEVTTIDVPPTLFLRDYQMGDKVTVMVPGHKPVTNRIREINVRLTQENGEQIAVTVGTQTAGQYLDILKNVDSVRKKVGLLQKTR